MKACIRPLGYLLTVLSLAYIVNIFLHFDWQALRFENPLLSLGYILLFGLWASLFILVGAYNWKLILEFLADEPLPARDVFSVFIRSNVAKYLPGNVMHYAGRNFLGSRLGWSNSEIAFSSLLEFVFGLGLTGLVIVLFLAAGLVTLPAQVPLTLNYERLARYAVLAASALLLALLLVYAYRLLVRRESMSAISTRIFTRGRQFLSRRFLLLVAKMFLLSLFCFVLNCAFYFYLCDLVLGFRLRTADFFSANAALSIANYMGVVTPGVPGGLGVKESVSVLLITAYGYPKEALLLSVVVFRVTCVLGDLLPYLVLKLGAARSARSMRDS
jgi:uncharacterized membrane protein YbhN (UPF0104 family)